MARIKIQDIPDDRKFSKEDMRRIFGGSGAADDEEKLQTVGEDGQLAQIDLTELLRKQQKFVNFYNGMSRLLFDTSMTIIRKFD
ncbi:MAG: hypothetical protein JXB48_13810 [Candidatus Latescibacteria bacterium]|nr:hypothetical protein [Candidatus Latescibacterota bacterium]